jgi:hypothetical protein
MVFPYQDPESTTYIPVFRVFGIDVYVCIYIYIVPIFSAQPCEMGTTKRRSPTSPREIKMEDENDSESKSNTVPKCTKQNWKKHEKTTSRVQADTS